MPPRNPYLCLSIVMILGVILLVGTAGIIALALQGKEAPGSLIAIASAAIGSLSSFLVSPPRGSAGYDQQPQQKGPQGTLP